MGKKLIVNIEVSESLDIENLPDEFKNMTNLELTNYFGDNVDKSIEHVKNELGVDEVNVIDFKIVDIK